MDDIDRAQERDQAIRDAAIAAALRRIEAAFSPRDANTDGSCIDCDQPIDPRRLAAIKTARCAHCAGLNEQRMRHWKS